LTQLQFLTTSFCSLFGGQQAANLYSARIFEVALIHGGQTSAFVFQLNFSEVVASSKLFTSDSTQEFKFVRTHIAAQQLLLFDPSHVLFSQVCI